MILFVPSRILALSLFFFLFCFFGPGAPEGSSAEVPFWLTLAYLLHIVGSLQSPLFGTVTMNDVNHHY